MDNESRIKEIEHYGTDAVLYEIWREEQGKRQNRFIAIQPVKESYQVSVTELTFFLTDGIATDMRGALPVSTQPLRSFPTHEQAKVEAKVVFIDYLKRGWLEVSDTSRLAVSS
jgi:hypothetical protein